MKKRNALVLVFCLLTTALFPLAAQRQIGGDILGEPNDALGTAISLSADGRRIASSTSAGQIRIYDLVGEEWVSVGAIIDEDPIRERSFSLSANGRRIAVKTLDDSSNRIIRVFESIDGNWLQVGEDIKGRGREEIDAVEQLGFSMSLSEDGNRLAVAVGTITDQIDILWVRIYELADGAWSQVGEDIDQEAFNLSLDLSADGNRLAIGAPDYELARVFELQGEDWTQIGEDVSSGPELYYFGSDISLSANGDRMAIGGGGWVSDNDPGTNVHIYELVDGVWTQLGQATDEATARRLLGSAVSLSANGNRVAIGDPRDKTLGPFAGQARVFELINGIWVPYGAIINPEGPSESLGKAVALSADGTWIAVGAPFNDRNGQSSGLVQVFDPTGAPNQRPTAILAADAEAGLAPLTVNFDASGSFDPDGQIVNYQFDFGDGSAPVSGSSPVTTHIYQEVGTYNATVTVTDNNGAVAQSMTVQIAASQVGDDIDGVESENFSGGSVSISADGQRVAVGAAFNDDGGENAGQVRVFEFNGFDWAQLGAGIDGQSVDERLGKVVSLSADGNRVAIGVPGVRLTTTIGKVRVYDQINGTWVQVGSDIEGENPDDRAAVAVSISADGRRVAIGAPLNDDGATDGGQVRVFELINGNWIQIGGDIEGVTFREESGSSVALSGDGSRVAIGAPKNFETGADRGQVRIYELIAGHWMQIGSDINGEEPEDEFGTTVSISTDGQTVAIGAPENEGTARGAGHVRVYQYNGSDWMQIGADIDGEAEWDNSGGAISLSADGLRLAIGARANDGEGPEFSFFGHTRIYDLIGGNWTQIGFDIDGEAEGDFSGEAVALSANGARVAIGASQNDGNGNDAGHVRVYELPLLSGPNIQRFQLVNRQRQVIDANLTNGEAIDLNETGDIDFNIQAITNPSTVGSVYLELDGPRTVRRTENVIPYEVFGNSAEPLAVGTYRLRATPYSGSNRSGEQGITSEITFEVRFENTIERIDLLGEFGQPLQTDLNNGAVLDLNALGDQKFDFEALAVPAGTDAVLFTLEGPLNFQRLSTFGRYRLFESPGRFLPLGEYTLTAQPVRETTGEPTGPARTLDFTVAADVSVQQFNLDDSNGNTLIENISDGAVLDLNVLGDLLFNIEAVATNVVDNVEFFLTGPINLQRTEIEVPFDLFDQAPQELLPGAYQLRAVPRRANGEVGTELQIDFTVVIDPMVPQLRLVNAAREVLIPNLMEGAVIDLADYSAGTQFNIEAVTDPEGVGSVVFDLTGPITLNRTENFVPYEVFGNGQRALPVGAYEITATPFNLRGGQGTAGSPVNIRFQVIDSGVGRFGVQPPFSATPSNQIGYLYPNPARDAVQLSLPALEGVGQIVVTDVAGREVLRQQQDLSAARVITLDIRDWKPGIYTVQTILKDQPLSAWRLIVH